MSSTQAIERARRVLSMCEEVGFALAGVCRAEVSSRAEDVRAWLARGEHGEMNFLEDELEKRLDVRGLLAEVAPGRSARSVLMVADQYAGRGDRDDPEAFKGRVARYVRGPDYHKVIKRRLHHLADRLRKEFPGSAFRSFVDTAPVMEREHAVRAGLGWTGKHTLLIHPRRGSWLVLGGFATDLELEPPAEQAAARDHCGVCTRCIDACPTGAITPYRVDARRCVSYLTIEHRGEIAPELRAGVGDWLFGCDVCQEVCPHNSAREDGVPADPRYAPSRRSFDLLGVLSWGEPERREAFARSALKRANLAMIRRNAVIVAGNAIRAHPQDPRSAALRGRLAEIASDPGESDLVRRTAAAVVASL